MHDLFMTEDVVATALIDAASRIAFADLVNDGGHPSDLEMEEVFAPDEISPALRSAFAVARERCPLPVGHPERRDWLRRYAATIAGGRAYQTLHDRDDESVRGAAPEFDPNAWPPLRDLPPISEPVPTLPDCLIPEPLRGWLADAAERTSIPLEFVAAPALVGLGAVVGRTVGIHPKRHDDWLVVPNLWGGVVGRPGVMKSAALSEALRPLRRLALDAGTQFKADRVTGDSNMMIALAKIDVIKGQVKKAARDEDAPELERLAREQALILQAARESTPHERRYMTQDGTVEKIGELLIENPRGLLILRDELSGWMRRLDKKGLEGDREFYLESWNGTDSYTYDRVGRGTLHVPALTLSICGGIQPGKLHDYVAAMLRGGKGDDGLLQRFQLFVWPDQLGEWRNVDRWALKDARDRAFRIYSTLDTLEPTAIGADCSEPDEIPSLRFAPDAQELFDAWRTDLEHRLRSPEIQTVPAFESHLAKFRSLMPAIAELLHLVDLVDGRASGPVAFEPAQRAAEWCDFLEPHARKVYGAALNADIAAAHALAAKVKAGAVKHGMTVRDVARREWSGLAREGAVHEALAVLERVGWARCQRCPTGGRPSDVIELHPALRRKP